MTASSRHWEFRTRDKVSGADCRGDLASPVGCGVQETKQRGEISLWENEMAGVDWRRRQVRIAQAQ